MGIFKKITQIALTPSVVGANLILKGISAVTGKEYKKATAAEAAETTFGKVLGASIAGTATALGAAVVATTPVLAAAATKVIPKTTKGKAIAAVVTPVVAGAVISEPIETAKAVASAPVNLAEFGGNIATFVAKPSTETAKDIFKDTPVIATAAAGAGIIAAGAGISSAVSGILTREEMKQQTSALESIATTAQIQNSPSSSTALPQVYPDIATKTPIVPIEETATLAETTTKKRKKRRLEPRTQTISQRVNVQVGVNSGNKKYIKNVVLVPA